MPGILPAFPCSASSDLTTPGGLLLRHFTVTAPSVSSPEESSLTLISTILPLHDINEAMKNEVAFSISTNRQVSSLRLFVTFSCISA
jgi:hypothetical protein